MAAALRKFSPEGRAMTQALNSWKARKEMHRLMLRAGAALFYAKVRKAFSSWDFIIQQQYRIAGAVQRMLHQLEWVMKRSVEQTLQEQNAESGVTRDPSHLDPSHLDPSQLDPSHDQAARKRQRAWPGHCMWRRMLDSIRVACGRAASSRSGQEPLVSPLSQRSESDFPSIQ